MEGDDDYMLQMALQISKQQSGSQQIEEDQYQVQEMLLGQYNLLNKQYSDKAENKQEQPIPVIQRNDQQLTVEQQRAIDEIRREEDVDIQEDHSAINQIPQLTKPFSNFSQKSVKSSKSKKSQNLSKKSSQKSQQSNQEEQKIEVEEDNYDDDNDIEEDDDDDYDDDGDDDDWYEQQMQQDDIDKQDSSKFYCPICGQYYYHEKGLILQNCKHLVDEKCLFDKCKTDYCWNRNIKCPRHGCEVELTKTEAQFIFGGDEHCNARREMADALEICKGDLLDAYELLSFREYHKQVENKKLTLEQFKALDYITQRAIKFSMEARHGSLKTLMESMGYKDKKQIQQLVQYIREEAPVCIHFNFGQDMQYYLNDSNYRNLFEVSRGRGSTDKNVRKTWEKNLFNGHYDDVQPFDRVKYGVLNYLKNPNGVQSCAHYGKSVMFLKDVSLRTTYADQDTGNVGQVKDKLKLATCAHYGHILAQFPKSQIEKLLDIIGKKKEYHENYDGTTYREAQIHGEINFAKHVEKVYVCRQEFSGSDKDFQDEMKKFTIKFGVPMYVQQ